MKIISLKQFLILSILSVIFLSHDLSAQSNLKIYEQTLSIPTYRIHKPDLNPMFFNGESYQGSSKHIYPYPLLDHLSNERVVKDWIGLFLENEYIKACITPELGGKLYWGEDKTTGYNFFYKNEVVKPANIGMLGAWVSGGVEWNVLHHHRASTFMPVQYTLKENKDGSKTIWIGETEPRHRMRWIIGLTAFPGKAYLEAEIKIMNPTPLTHSFLYWANVSTHANKDYQVYFPPSTNFGTDHSKVDFTHWPISDDPYKGIERPEPVNMGKWMNHPLPTSIFCYDLKEDFMGGYDHGKELGTVHVGDHHVVTGAKLFEWGPSELGQMWEKVLTEKDGPYIELMVGAYSDNQPDYSWIRPYEVKTFKQYWYPISKIGGILNANLNGAVNLEMKDESKVFFGFSVTQKFDNAMVLLHVGEKNIFKKEISIEPGKSFTTEVKIPEGISQYDLKVSLLNSKGEELIAYQPKKKEPVKDLPEFVKPPLPPEEIKSVEELYLTGLRLIEFYNPVKDPMPYFEEALKRDPDNSNVCTILGKDAWLNGEFDKAETYFRKSIKRLVYPYTRPENCEAFYGLGQVLKYKEKYDDAEDTLYRATWDYSFSSAAYQSLAEIKCSSKDFEKSLEHINRSLNTNNQNLKAYLLKSAIERHLGNYNESLELAKHVINEDPLNLWAAYESFLALNAMGQNGETVMNSMEGNMTGDHEDYLEIAAEYLNWGLYDEGIVLLNRFITKNDGAEKADPMVNYYLGYLNERNGEEGKAENYYRIASNQSTDYCFPFRMESLKVLNAAIKTNPDDAKAYYYLGNILYDHQPQKAIACWEKAVAKDPSMAIAYRNLGWAYYWAENKIENAFINYEKAISIKNDDPIYYYELDLLYEIYSASPEKRLASLEPNHNIVKKRNDSFLREIMVLTLNGKCEKAVEYLSNNHFHIREGNMKIRDIHVDARLMLGNKYFAEKKYKAALNQYLLANTFPENQQVGQIRNDQRVPQINYFIGKAYDAIGDKKNAITFYKLSVQQNIGTSEYSYYQGLAYLKLGEKEKADEVFNALIESGESVLDEGFENDVFAKFTENNNDYMVKSNAHLKIGLGSFGKNNIENAKKHLRNSVEINAGNLWAQVALDEL